MKKFLRFDVLVVLFGAAVITLVVFRQHFFEHKTVFPSNLLVSSYPPWKYEPVPEYPNGPPNKPMGFDNVRQFFPDRVMLKESLSKGVIPLWNPYIYSGTPFMAAFDTAVWYPFSLIAAALPAIDGWNFLVIVQPVISVFFMYLFLRSMKFRPALAAYGAFTYALCGWMAVYWQEILVLEHSFLWLPLALYASNRLWERETDAVGFLLLVFALVCSIFGGFLQMAAYVYIVVLIWNVYLSVQRKRVDPWISIAIALSVFVACIQLVPSIEAFLSSPRGASSGFGTFRLALLPLRNIITFIAPDYWGSPATYNYFGSAGFYFEKMIFIGVIPLLFAAYGMFEGKKKNVAFWIILALATLSMGFALPTSWLPYYLHLPVLSNSFPTRIFAVSAFSLVTLSCFGVSSFLAAPDRKRLACVLTVITVVLLIGWLVVASAWLDVHGYISIALWRTKPNEINDSISYATVSLRNLLIPSLFVFSGWVVLAASKFFKRVVFGLVCVTTLASSLYFSQKYVYFGEERFVYPNLPVISKLGDLAGYDRVWGYGNAFIEKNLPQYFRWFSTDGYGNLSSDRYGQLLSTIVNNGKLGGQIRRSDTDLYETSEWDRFGSVNPYRLRMMSLFGVKYVLEAKKGDLKDKISTEVRFPSPEFALAWEDPSWRIWQYNKANPRVVFVTQYLVRNRPQELVDTLYDPSVDLVSTVVLEREPDMKPSSGADASAVITSYGLNTVTISTDSSRDGFVVLSDTYYPGWIAAVDGKPAEIYRANYTIRAVPVPKGTHIVTFIYKPVSFIIGSVLTLIGILLTVGVSYRIANKAE
jgi:hypothetical protein